MLKKIMLLCVFVFVATFSNAQVAEVKINPIAMLFGKYSVSAEYLMAENMGIEAEVEFINQNIKSVNRKGFGLSSSFNYYFNSERKCENFYAFPYLKYRTVSWDSNVQNRNGEFVSVGKVIFGLGLGAGYKWVSANNITFDIGIGLGKNIVNRYSWENIDDSIDKENFKFNLFGINSFGKLAVGYRF